jgi:enoyl-CoA hydratase
MTSDDEITVERHGGVAILGLNAPRRRNALTLSMARALVSACDELDADESVGAVVVKGEGSFFCAGADLATLARVGEDPAEAERYDALGAIYAAFLRVGRLRAPTIAAIRGGAIGAGLNLALSTDLRIISDHARLRAGFLPIGAHPGGGGLTLLHRLVGSDTAVAIMLFDEEVTGTRAVEIGIAWAAVPDREVEARALALAQKPAADPTLARLATHSLRAEAEFHLPLDIAVAYERSAQMWSLRRRTDRSKNVAPMSGEEG